jgi:glycine cleavage system regulatory protein
MAQGVSQRAIAKKYGVSHPTVAKHFKEHVAEALKRSNIIEPVLGQLAKLVTRIDRLCTKAEEAEDLPTAVKAAHEIRETLMSVAKLTGEDKSASSEPVTVEIVYVDRPRILVNDS